MPPEPSRAKIVYFPNAVGPIRSSVFDASLGCAIGAEHKPSGALRQDNAHAQSEARSAPSMRSFSAGVPTVMRSRRVSAPPCA